MNRIVDAHNHVNWHGRDADRVVANMDRHGIGKTWLLSWEIPESERRHVADSYAAVLDPRDTAGLTLAMVVEALRKHPRRFVAGWAPDPRDRHARARLKAAVAIHGIRICGELKCRMRYDSPDAIAMFHTCAELGLPVLFHLEAPEYRLKQQCKGPDEWPEWYGGDIAVVDTMCRLCPQTLFIGHGPGFWREMSGGAARSAKAYPDGPVRSGSRLLKILRKHRNLYADLSAGSGRNALARDLKHARSFLLEFQDRVLFGRDGFDGSLLDLLDRLKLPVVVRNKILFRNAENILKKPGKKLLGVIRAHSSDLPSRNEIGRKRP